MELSRVFTWLALGFGLAVSIILALQFGGVFSTGSGAQEKQPNIVFILADDLGYNDVGYHNKDIKTPMIDQVCHIGIIIYGFQSPG